MHTGIITDTIATVVCPVNSMSLNIYTQIAAGL